MIGNDEIPLLDRIQSKDNSGTLLLGMTNSSTNYKVWLRETAQPKGKVFIDKGAEVALKEKGASLLLPGIRSFSGVFNERDVIDICAAEGGELVARGFSRQGSNWLTEAIKLSTLKHNKPSSRDSLLVVHRNDLALL